MHATLPFPTGPLSVLLAVFFLALLAALAPGLSELDLSGLSGGTGDPGASVDSTPDANREPAWLGNPLEPPLTSMERAARSG
ncbi:MAG TPA: hypothetical protein VHJ37_01040 [Thermoleophilaceae bacterium]|jgi:hypothetical protein|nr:hypothetical protein [Thermoleophilaceae bacterium]